MTAKSLLIHLIKSAVTGDPLTDDQKAAIEAQTFCLPLFRLAEHHKLLHLVAAGLQKNDCILADKELAQTAETRQFTTFWQYEQSAFALKQFSDLLEEAKIPFIPLKGMEIRKLYPEEWMRNSCDIDILVHEADVERAATLIEERLGYKRRDKTYHDISLYSDTGVLLELHFSIQENIDSIDRLLSRVWDYATPVDENGYRHQLTPEYLIFHVLAHTSYHFLHGGCGVRPILDLWLLRQKLPYNAETLADMCAETQLTVFYQALVDLMNYWFGNAKPTPLSLQLEDYIFSGGVYGTLKNRVAVQRRNGGKWSYLFRRAWLPIDELRTSYPVLNEKPWLSPFCQIGRWGKAIVSGRVGKSKREWKVNQEVSHTKAENIKQLLDLLEL